MKANVLQKTVWTIVYAACASIAEILYSIRFLYTEQLDLRTLDNAI